MQVLQDKDTKEKLVEVCDYLDGARAAVTASVDGLAEYEHKAPNYWWADQPGGDFSRLLAFKQRHPKFKITLTFTPRNRWGLAGADNRWHPEEVPKEEHLDVRNAPSFVRDWLRRIQRDYGWLEVASHGVTHSPDGATILGQAEFDPACNPNALDLGWCRTRVREIRNIIGQL